MSSSPIAPDTRTRIWPTIEEVTGGVHLDRYPSTRPMSTVDFRKALDPELQAYVRCRYPNLSNATRAKYVEYARDGLRLLSVAEHRPGSDTVDLTTSSALAHWVEHETPNGTNAASFRQDFALLCLVHANVHYVLDQRYGLASRWAECRDWEESQALQAVVEGHALSITRDVGYRLHIDAPFPLLIERYRMERLFPVARTDDEAGIRAMVEEVVKQRHWACEKGLAFIAYLRRNHVPELEAFKNPPRRTAEIEDPALYVRSLASGEARKRVAGVATALDAGRCSLPSSDWDVHPEPWTPDMVRQVALLLHARDRADARSAAATR
jgi:hypothetical protein